MNTLRAAGTDRMKRQRSRAGTVWRLGVIFMVLMLVTGSAASIHAASLSLNRQQLVLFTGQHASLTVNGKKKGKTVKWRSSDRKTARVDRTGTVTAVKKGKAAITARIGKKKLSCTVIVKNDPAPRAVERAKAVAAGAFSCTDRPGRTLISTGMPRLDYLTETLVREMGIDGSWSDEQILKRIYTYMSRHFYYLKDRHYMDTLPVYYHADLLEEKINAFEKVTKQAASQGKIRFTDKFAGVMSVIGTGGKEAVSGKNIRIDDVSAHIESHEGVCDNHADVFSVVCAHLGIESGIAGGSISGNAHTWSWAKLKGKKYYFDIGSAIHDFRRTGKVTMGYFKMKKNKMKRYRFRTEY